jgi:hypothetical protein
VGITAGPSGGCSGEVATALLRPELNMRGRGWGGDDDEAYGGVGEVRCG